MHRKFAISDSTQRPAYNILVLDTQSFKLLIVVVPTYERYER